MYGKLFSSTFTGSMVGSGPVVFSVWGYVIAHAVQSQVELNPALLAVVLGCPEDKVEAAISVLCSKDPRSRSKDEDGRRIVREGQFAYRVVNHTKYNAMRNEGDRREYNRIKQQEHRERVKLASVPKEQAERALAHSAPGGPRPPSKRELQQERTMVEMAALGGDHGAKQ